MSMDDEIGTRAIDTITVEMSREDAALLIRALDGYVVRGMSVPSPDVLRAEGLRQQIARKVETG